MILCLVKFVLINRNMPRHVIIFQYFSYDEIQQSTGSSCHVQSVLYLQNNNWRFMLSCRFFLMTITTKHGAESKKTQPFVFLFYFVSQILKTEPVQHIYL